MKSIISQISLILVRSTVPGLFVIVLGINQAKATAAQISHEPITVGISHEPLGISHEPVSLLSHKK